MQIILRTKVPGYYTEIMQAFDRNLFEALKPKGAKMEIVEFTGSKKGDTVHLRFLFPFKMEWISKITEDAVSPEEAYFIDVGTKLPPGLNSWKHRHVVKNIDSKQSWIIDDIQYRGVNRLLTILLYPILYLAFYPRKKIYRAYFTRLNQMRQGSHEEG